MKSKQFIEELQKILHQAQETTPPHLRGLLIPEHLLGAFYSDLEIICSKAKFSEEYFELMWKGEQVREKMKFDFIQILIDQAQKGGLKP